MKKTLNRKIRELKFKQPNPIINGALSLVARGVYYGPCKVHIDRRVDPKNYLDKPVIVVANHASRFDYAFVNFAMKRRRINFVAAENEFHRAKFRVIFKVGHVIPKRNFVPDVQTIRGISRVIKHTKNGCVALFPCGMSTVSGAQQPSMLGTGKLLKHFGVHVLCVRIHGGYLVCPKFDVKERFGKVEIELDELFDPQQLGELSAEEIERKVDEALFCDDYEWNATRQNSYVRKDRKYAQNMEQVLYKCPQCGAELHNEGVGDVIRCRQCGNAARLDDKYNLIPIGGSVIPVNPREWFDWQRREMYKAVRADDFCLEEHVKLGLLPRFDYLRHNKVAEIVGEGTLRLDRTGLHFKGIREEIPWDLFIASEHINTVCLPVDGSYFYTYASGEFLQFVPDSPSSVRWMLAIEELYRLNGGSWRNYPWFDYSAPLKLQR